MIQADDPTRQRLIHQVLRARLLPAIAVAAQALRQWIQEHPEDQGMRDGFEQLYLMQEIHDWRAANPEEWAAEQEVERCAIAAHEPERREMLGQAGQARTEAELDRAEAALFEWSARHPEDAGRELGIVEALEQVVTRREALTRPETHALAGRAA